MIADQRWPPKAPFTQTEILSFSEFFDVWSIIFSAWYKKKSQNPNKVPSASHQLFRLLVFLADYFCHLKHLNLISNGSIWRLKCFEI